MLDEKFPNLALAICSIEVNMESSFGPKHDVATNATTTSPVTQFEKLRITHLL